MSNTTITLTRDEIFDAVSKYVEEKYPVKSEQVTIHWKSGIHSAEVECSIQK